MTLNKKQIIVLGGTSGIGLAVAQAAAAEGARIVIASSNSARVSAALATMPRGAEGQTLDLTDGTAVEAFFGAAGPFDHLVYTAGELLALHRLRRARSQAPAVSSSCGIGVPSPRPSGRTAGSGQAARSCSPLGWPEPGPVRVGRSPRASAQRWRV